MLTSPVILVMCTFAMSLGSFCLLHALRKCEKVLIDMGWFPRSFMTSHRMAMALWSAVIVLSLSAVSVVFPDVSCKSSESSENSISISLRSFCPVCLGCVVVVVCVLG